MNIHKEELLLAASQVGIDKAKAENLWKFLAQQRQPGNKFDLSHVLYYIGALIVIAALGWLLGTGWEKFGGKGIMLISLAYIALFMVPGTLLWQKNNLRVPGGLFITMAVCLIPLAVYGFQKYTGWWYETEPAKYQDFFYWVKGQWFAMEFVTIMGGILAIWLFRFPFLTAPLFFSLWFMSMDVTPLIFGENFEWRDQLSISMWFGLGIIIISYLIDRRTREDFAFWG